ncbi:MAG: hypothetical protein CSA18_05065, partial [Deltaproteobacteria bacterium]
NYYGFRFYAPSIGKWLTRDPLGEAGGINVYGFVLNNPLVFFDPTGLISCKGKWQRRHWVYLQPRIARRCVCYWRCEPCKGGIWNGNVFNLPETFGTVIYQGKDIEEGGNCLCDFPGPEEECDDEYEQDDSIPSE